jgi:class 3 adenylate cyclase
VAATASGAGRYALSGNTTVRPDRARHHMRTAAVRHLTGLCSAAVRVSLSLNVEVGAAAIAPSQRAGLVGQNCTIVASDVVSFGASMRTDADRRAIRAATASMTEAAFQSVWPRCGSQDCGDGMIVVIPPDTPTTAVLSTLLAVLPAALAAHNAAHEPGASIQLRVSVHVGPVVADATGLSGDAIIEAARMLDAAPFKDAVARSAPAMGLITSSFVFETAVRNGGLSGDRSWTPIAATVKERDLAAWYHLVGPGRQVEAEPGGRLQARLAALPRVPFQRR